MVAQERARWLNLSSLSLREKTQLLDVPVDPKDLFGPAYGVMLKRWEEKKREGEALRLCLPRRAPFPTNTPGQVFTQPCASPPAYRTLQKACRRPFGLHSSPPGKGEKGRTCRELGGADLLDKGKAFSTVKVYLAAISACHIGFGDKTAGQHPIVCRFMKGARRLRPVSRNLTAPWDLSTVLDALSHPPFEPLQQVELASLLLALASAKRVSDIHALSEQEQLNALCQVRALRVYVDRTAGFRKSEQLFVSCATSHLGKPLSLDRGGYSHGL
ncbi:hypothetical protein N1851_009321 [Merluccius polli]|uniref:Uncharacterized protein n=1 Tax=Merluccius polli TaxID=89951 RepID=A0AA47P448_MERPO|nr:hypothetical protein N1851_009321 [Merluccius polli]